MSFWGGVRGEDAEVFFSGVVEEVFGFFGADAGVGDDDVDEGGVEAGEVVLAALAFDEFIGVGGDAADSGGGEESGFALAFGFMVAETAVAEIALGFADGGG